MRAVPHLCVLYPGICLTTEEKAGENLSRYHLTLHSQRNWMTRVSDGTWSSCPQWQMIISFSIRLRMQLSKHSDSCRMDDGRIRTRFSAHGRNFLLHQHIAISYGTYSASNSMATRSQGMRLNTHPNPRQRLKMHGDIYWGADKYLARPGRK